MTNNSEQIEFSPENIAQALFTQDPKPPCSHQILTYDEKTDNKKYGDLTYIFEILITILMEGLDIFSGGLDKTDLNNFTEKHITNLNPWFNSIGFNINVETFTKDVKDICKDQYDNYYCKIMVRTKLFETFFLMKNVSKNYHFLLNGKCIEENKNKQKINEISAVFCNIDDTIYKISFNFIQS